MSAPRWLALVSLALTARCAHRSAPPPVIRNATVAATPTSSPGSSKWDRPRATVPSKPGPGSIRGVVRVLEDGSALPGATLVATSADDASDTAQVWSALADEHGRYQLLGIPDGRYVVTAYYADLSQAIEPQPVRVGTARIVDVTLDLHANDARYLE